MLKQGKTIYEFINKLWKFIKATEIPAQDNQSAWDQVVDDATELTKEYNTNDPLHRLFRTWVIAYLDYMSVTSKGFPTVMQEANKVKAEI